jgi:HAD superfamily hydrolase (TIGR01509 family)
MSRHTIRNAGYEAVLFDFDGVLADTEPLHWEAWRDAVKPLGIELTWQLYRDELIGVSDPDLVRFLASVARSPVPEQLVWQRFPEKQRLFLAKALASPPIPEPIRQMINHLSHIKLAVVTSTSIREIEPLLVAAALRDCFQTIVAAEDVTRHKPDPEPYLEAARRLSVSRALVVEDSDAGEAAARRAGFDVLRVGSPQEVPEAVLRRLQEAAGF